MTRLVMAALAASVLSATPTLAQDADPLAPRPQEATPPADASPAQVPVRLERDWPSILNAISRQQWEVARQSIAAMDRSDPLHDYALAELYLAAGSPRIDGPSAARVAERSAELPQAGALARIAADRGGDTVRVPGERTLVTLGGAPRRYRARSVGGAQVENLLAQLGPAVEADDGRAGEEIYRAAVETGGLSGEAWAEISHRVAWIYYVAGDIANARRIALEGLSAGTAEWRAQSAWIFGLSSWRQNDCISAATGFRLAALGTRDRELGAAGHYWTARANQRCGRAERVAQSYRAAAVDPETFYGQLARERLGEPRALPVRVQDPSPTEERAVAALPNVQRARSLAAMGRRAEAEALLRHQARIGDPAQHRLLVAEAAELGLGVQYFLATNAPRGTLLNARDRYPAPDYTPDNGWRIDPYLAFSHIIQESDFRETVVSPADAVGLMQVRPGTARDTARARGETVTADQLKRPQTNIDHGQAFIQQMRSNRATGDELMRIIAAYNAGPVPVARWASIPGEDPLLWMESLPYWETRFYIPAVLRNYFVYHAEAGTTPPALVDLVQGRTPRFPAR
ncbi:lytic transglycosylase domain-containing protein [Sphingomicrobium sp. XHP0239]|uniref:lytic transglycosylase domain-containing protein n=1 Tax=Sphingomicrobium maritimum TaxID=3133972 RepID=UPI0031CCCC1E